MRYFTSFFFRTGSLKSGAQFTLREHIANFRSHLWSVATILDGVDQEGCSLFGEWGPCQLIFNMLNVICVNNMPILVSPFIHIFGQSVIQKVLNEHLSARCWPVYNTSLSFCFLSSLSIFCQLFSCIPRLQKFSVQLRQDQL